MKTTFLRASACLLALLMSASLLASCKEQKPAEGESSSDGATETVTSAPRPVLPPEKLPDMNPEIESNAGDVLAGYTKNQLVEKWGYPFGELYGENGFAWLMENGLDYALARFDSEDYVTELSFFHVMKATVLSISDDVVTLAPAEGMEECALLESFTLPMSAFGSKTREKMAEGLLIFISYDGVITADGGFGTLYRAESSSPMSGFARY